MKVLPSIFGVIAGTMALQVQADPTPNLYLGAGQWQVNFEGAIGERGFNTTFDKLGFQDEQTNLLWLNFEHSLPALPNLRLMHSRIDTSSRSTSHQGFRFAGITIDAQVGVLTDIEFSHTDATLYYKLVDSWMVLDVGVTARLFDGLFSVQSQLTPPTRAQLKGGLPMAYVNAHFEHPYSNMFVGFNGNVMSFEGDSVIDYSATIGYLFDIAPRLKVGFNLGYRSLTINAEDFQQLYADATIAGGFAELLIRF